MSHDDTAVVTVTELPSVTTTTDDGGTSAVTVRHFRMVSSHNNNKAVVQVGSLGAALTHWYVPPPRTTKTTTTTTNTTDNSVDMHQVLTEWDDVVLGHDSLVDQWTSDNPTYFGVVVGRVANRIAHGQFTLTKDDDRVDSNEEDHSYHHHHHHHQYVLETNNDNRHHLHGGRRGFSHVNWQATILHNKGVEFTYLSRDGDQGYPGTVQVTVTYTVHPTETGIRLTVQFQGRLVLSTTDDDHTLATPINLAQHSYFNLARHDDPCGILDHQLQIHSSSYLPIDPYGIPTRQIQSLDHDPVMDWRQSRILRNALRDYGRTKACSSQDALDTLSVRVAPDLAVYGPSHPNHGQPYGYDHCYIIDQEATKEQEDETDSETTSNAVRLVAVLEHAASHRQLRVSSNAPGVQLYTANFLDGQSPPRQYCKQKSVYGQWQGLCLETQHYPDSILTKEEEQRHPDFAKGKCVILRPENPTYQQVIQYELSDTTKVSTDSEERHPVDFAGKDSNGNEYSSIDELWESQGVNPHAPCTENGSWYNRASAYYEENCDTTLDGVLGGFASLSDTDLEESAQFVKSLESLGGSDFTWAAGASCECGAGIGRVTKGLLLSLGTLQCDLVESSPRLLSAAPDYIGEEADRCKFYCSGLQNWQPQPNFYSIIWVQWTFCYLTDYDAVEFLRRCGEGLVDGGFICLKENVCTETDFVADLDDASVTRSVRFLRHLATRAGLTLVAERIQTSFPDDIFPVPMLAFQTMRSRAPR